MSFVLHTEEDERTCPRFQCDHCHEFIADASRALLLWDDYAAGTWIPRVVCKECDRAIERTMRPFPMTMELDTALMFLLNNSGMDKQAITQARRKAMLLGGCLGLPVGLYSSRSFKRAFAALPQTAYLMRVGNVQLQVRATARRLKAVELCQRGMSNEQIAKELGVTTARINQYLNRDLQTDTRFPVGIDASKAELMRSEQLLHLEVRQRRLLNRAEKIAAIAAYSPDEARQLASAAAKLSDSFVKVSERISAMFGLDAPKPVAPPANVTNNNMVIMSFQLVERIKLRRAEQLNGAMKALASPVENGEERTTLAQEGPVGRPDRLDVGN